MREEFEEYEEETASGMLEDDELSAGEEGFLLGYEADFEE